MFFKIASIYTHRCVAYLLIYVMQIDALQSYGDNLKETLRIEIE